MLKPQQLKLIFDYGKVQYPKEAVVVVLDKGEVMFLPNISKNPTEQFEVFSFPENTAYVIHSHPDAPNVPSKADMLSQEGTGKPWGIFSVYKNRGILQTSSIQWLGMNDVLKTPLVGRPFIHGVTDCYSAVRSFYCQTAERIKDELGTKNTELVEYLDDREPFLMNDYPRSNLWWDNGEDLYRESFRKEDFYEIKRRVLKAGDGVLYKINSPVVNHSAVYLGDNKIYHHLYNRPSSITTIYNWGKFAKLYVRHAT